MATAEPVSWAPLPPDGVALEAAVPAGRGPDRRRAVATLAAAPALPRPGIFVVEGTASSAFVRHSARYGDDPEGTDRCLANLVATIEPGPARIVASAAARWAGYLNRADPGPTSQGGSGWFGPFTSAMSPMRTVGSRPLAALPDGALDALERWAADHRIVEIEFLADDSGAVSVVRSDARPPAPGPAGTAPSTGLGLAAVVGSVTGPARPRRSPGSPATEGILMIEQADPALAPLLAEASGLVCAEGGATSHFAVVSRAIGLPALVGCVGLSVEEDGVAQIMSEGHTVEIRDGEPVELVVTDAGSTMHLTRTGRWIR